MTALRRILMTLLVIALPLSISACGFRGDKDLDTQDAEGGIGKGPGLLTGKRGGLIIYQR